MSEIDWGGVGVSELLPTGTVTLLLADVEGSTRLWEIQPDEMAAAVARLDRALSEVVAAHGGVRPVEQGEGDSFVIAFARASEAVACALDLQLAPLAPILLRIGLHTGEVRLRDEGNYIGPTINRTARLRDLAHGGQTVLSGATEELVYDQLPPDAFLVELGSHELRGVSRPERVVQLCHPDTRSEFPPLRTTKTFVAERLPTQLTSFVGRGSETAEVRQTLSGNRLVTLAGAGGVGKTRLGVHVAGLVAAEYGDEIWYVDLAPITDADLVPATVAAALGLPDQPGRSTVESLIRFAGQRHSLVLLDNCEHLLDACAALIMDLLEACPRLTLLATSREPIGVAGEVTWRVPSLSLADEAVELFVDRARRARPDFRLTDDNATVVTEICRRLDGMPLAIELAAARVRALSVGEIAESLNERFRLLTGGSRTSVRRQQTLRASVDWSHALLTEPERLLFRRLAVFMGGFDFDAAQAIAGATSLERYQILDQLALLVDKSLVIAENLSGRTRYKLLETVRQYAMEKLSESGEAGAVRARHRDYYTSLADLVDATGDANHEERVERAIRELDNLRSAFAWSRENSDFELALRLASSLHPLWLARGHFREGLYWLDSVLSDVEANGLEVAPAARVRAIADKTVLVAWGGWVEFSDEAEQALTIARELGDPALLVRALMARGYITAFDAGSAQPFFAEAADIARELGDSWRLCQVLGQQTVGAMAAGDPAAMLLLVDEALRVADALGDRYVARQCCFAQGWVRSCQGDLAGAVAKFREAIDAATAAHDVVLRAYGLVTQAATLAFAGDVAGARSSADAMVESVSELGDYHEGIRDATVALAALAAGDGAAAWRGYELARQRTGLPPTTVGIYPWAALAPLACGDFDAARRWADDIVAVTHGWYRSGALSTRARVALAQGQLEVADRDAHEALELAARLQGHVGIPDILECLAELAAEASSHREAARLLGAACAVRRGMGAVRFKTLDANYEARLAELRKALGEEFDAAWTEGVGLSIDEAVAYAQRGRGERKRPASGWAALTPAERDVVRLAVEGLGNKDIGARLFVSPRTVQTHLTHVYAKLGIASRVQLMAEAAQYRNGR
ncbi:MAG: hypothetical protein QOK33_1513 [Mycobacterium sp.]|nr:hypothetical protein [Mycobacterium sp.]